MSMIALLAVVQAVYADEPDIHISVAEITGCGIFEIASSRRHSGFSTTTMAADSVSGLDEPWEVVPGEWVFEIWYKDARLIRKTFSVVESTKE